MGGVGLSRRSLLESIGAGVVAAGFAGRGAGAVTAGRFNVGTSGRPAARDAANAADDSIRHIDLGDVGHVVTGRFSEGLLERIAAWDDVRYVEPDGLVRAIDHGGADDPADGQVVPWGIERVGADVAHHGHTVGSAVGVAILDTGVDPTHEDLAVAGGRAIVACASCEGGPQWADDNGHGTHVAGIVGARNDDAGVVGVAPAADLHAVKVLDDRGAGFVSDIADGLRWTADRSAIDVATMSLGSTARGGALQDACTYAHGQGLVLVAAAGNNTSLIPEAVAYPAAYEEVIAVSGTNQRDQLMTTSSSGSPVELAAPGNAITSTVPGGYGRKDGTSMAAPHVAGAAAGVMADGSGNVAARERLRATAEDLGLAASSQGHGLVDVPVALGVTVAVETRPATDVGGATATLRGEYRGIEPVAPGFRYRRSDDSAWTTVIPGETLEGSGPFAHELAGIESGTTYEYRAVVADAGDTDDVIRTGQVRTVTPGSGLLGGGGGLLGGGGLFGGGDGGGLFGGGGLVPGSLL